MVRRSYTPRHRTVRLETPRRSRSLPTGRAAVSTYSSRGGIAHAARRRRRRSGPGIALGVLVACALAVLAWWLLTRPVGAAVAVEPADAHVLLDGSIAATGTLSAEDLETGEHSLTMWRSGYATETTTVSVRRFGENRFDFELEPLPQRISIRVEPEGALCRVLRGDVELASGTGSLVATVPAGPIVIEASAEARNTLTREVFLDCARDFDFWLDPEGQLVHGLGTIAAAGAPKAVAITPDGTEVWTTILNGPPSIEIFDTASGRRTGTIDLGEYGAVEVVFNRAGTRAYASQMETARIFEIDTATLQVARSFDTESAWTKVVALSPDEATLYAANWSGDDVSEIDLASGKLLRRIRVSNTPRGLYPTPDGSALYVAGFDSGDLDRIDLASGKTETAFDGKGALRHIVGDAKRGVLFISDMADDLIWRHDMATGKTAKFVDTDEKPNTIDLSPDGRVLFVSCRGENNAKSYYIPGPEWGTILLFDAESGKPLDAIVGGNQCTALDVSDDGSLLVFSDFLDDRLRLYGIPAFDALAEGNGGRWEQHFGDLRK